MRWQDKYRLEQIRGGVMSEQIDADDLREAADDLEHMTHPTDLDVGRLNKIASQLEEAADRIERLEDASRRVLFSLQQSIKNFPAPGGASDRQMADTLRRALDGDDDE